MIALVSALIFIVLIGLLLWALSEMLWGNPDQPSRN